MTIIDAFHANVLRLKGSPCFKYKESGIWKSLSWNSAADAVAGYAEKLKSLGVKSGDTVGILSSTRVEWTIADLAILSIGAITVPIYPTLTAEQTKYILNDAGVEVAFVENSDLEKKLPHGLKALYFPAHSRTYAPFDFAQGRLTHSRTHDLASIIYTSGTTGEPKGVVISHENIMAEATSLMEIFKLSANEVILEFLPLAHVLGRAVQFYQLCTGCVGAYAESIEALPKNFKEIKPHMCICVPRVIEKMHEKVASKAARLSKIHWEPLKWAMNKLISFKLRSALGGRIKFLISGGAPLSPDIAKFFAKLGLLILEGYGLTETFAAITVNKPDDHHLGTVGKPLSGVSLKLADDNEVLVKGGMVFKEYFKLPQETVQAFTPDGWFKTGDIGEFSKDGFLRITGRKKEIIVTSGGKNVAPQAIENILKESPFISNAYVHGDKRKFLTALLTLNREELKKKFGATVDIQKLAGEIVDIANKKLAQFETIKKFTILESDFTIDSGEMTPTMKLKRRVIEEKYKDVLDNMYNG